MDGVILTPLKQVYHPKGSIFHAMKQSDLGYCGFGEAYFSTINKSNIKGWKKHTKMTLNLIVPIGEIQFVIFDENNSSFFSTKLSLDNYQRLTVKPGLWMAFRGLQENNLLLNLGSIEHDPDESVNVDLADISYEW